jgi:hypothetical protein
MGWSLNIRGTFRDREAVDVALLAAGKALYLANAFESKCQYVLRIAKLASFLEVHGNAGLDDALASLARDKFLHPTLEALKRFPVVRQEEVGILDRARDGRNFIAHEGGALGYAFDVTRSQVDDHLEKLRVAVVDLARGDNIVSRWVYEIEEKEPAPFQMVHSYPAMVEGWVFGDVRDA